MLRHCYELEVSQVLPLAARSTGGLRILLLLPRPTIPRLLSYRRGCARSRPRPGRRDLQKEGTLRELAQGSAFGALGHDFQGSWLFRNGSGVFGPGRVRETYRTGS